MFGKYDNYHDNKEDKENSDNGLGRRKGWGEDWYQSEYKSGGRDDNYANMARRVYPSLFPEMYSIEYLEYYIENIWY